jgi:16S rRNA processing protein RimM
MNYQAVGKIQKNFGATGELLIAWNADADWNTAGPLFIEIDGLWTPFFVKTVVEKGAKKVIVFEDMETESLSKTLINKELYVERKTVAKQKVSADDSLLNEWLGYTVIDNERAAGIITQWFDFRGNICFEIATDSNKVLIPAHPDFIDGQDKKKRLLYMHLPEGITVNE